MVSGATDKQITHHNHFVPQFYLRYWSCDDKSIWDYKLVVENERENIWRLTSLRTACSWDDLYTQRIAGADVDDIENYFCDKYESPASFVLRKMDGGFAISKNDIDRLVNYWLIQYFRTPSFMFKNAKLVPGAFDRVAAQISRLIDGYRCEKASGVDHGNSSHAISLEPFPDQPIEIDFDFKSEEVTSSISLGRTSFLSSIASLVNGTVGDIIRNYNWTIVRPPRGRYFITSDNPAVAYRVNSRNEIEVDGVGLGRSGTTLVLPLTPTAALVSRVGSLMLSIPEYLDGGQFDLINEAIYKSAYRHIFSKQKIPDIERIFPRVVNKRVVAEDREVRNSWAENQASLEEQYEERVSTKSRCS